jgi:hypothetical protein
MATTGVTLVLGNAPPAPVAPAPPPTPLMVFFRDRNFPLPTTLPPTNPFVHLNNFRTVRNLGILTDAYQPVWQAFLAAFKATYNSPTDRFFITYVENHDFEYNPHAFCTTSWRRLRRQLWPRDTEGDDDAETQARTQFFAAFIEEFGDYFGHADNDDGGELEKWRRLCDVLGVDTKDLPTTKTQYKKALAGIHVNIFDVLQHLRSGTLGDVRRFDTVRELARYSKSRRKIYPKVLAKGSALRFLLRELLRSDPGN